VFQDRVTSELLSEYHPLSFALAEQQPDVPDQITWVFPYLSQPKPIVWKAGGSYADPVRETVANETVEWPWGIGDVYGALTEAGFQSRSLREHAVGFYPVIPSMIEEDDGQWRFPEPLHGLYPLGFSVAAVRI
jgi:hypothetical protein